MKEVIDKAKQTSMDGKVLSRDVLLSLLELDPRSEEAEYLGRCARDIARIKGNNKARVGSSIGVDLAPCSMSCRFCSMGEKWGLVKEPYLIPDERIVSIIRDRVQKGYWQFTLRTTEFFDIGKLCDTAKKIRKEIPGEYILTANTGELTPEQAKMLKDAGFTGAYHALRLREGIDTPIPPSVRINTMNSIKGSGLYLGCGVDPIGTEHTNEELADILVFYSSMAPAGLCTMRRINVKGTPMEGIEEVDDDRMAQIAAVIRLVQSGRNVAVHPPIQKAMDNGANTVAIEIGANPRFSDHSDKNWTAISHEEAAKMFKRAGYDLSGPFHPDTK